MLPLTSRKDTFTDFRWPILCARSSAWMRSPGTQVSSEKTTVDAAVSVSPTPAALMDRMATWIEGSFWNDSTMDPRCCAGVLPSIRM